MMIKQSSGIAFRQKTIVKSESPKLTYIEERIKYNAELAALRKGWAIEIQLKKERDAALAKIERERIVLRQAVRLRQDRIESLIIQEKERVKKETADKKFKQHLANNLVVSHKRRRMQQLRFSQMIKDITEESEVWITNDNLNQRINTNLFAGMRATTGLVTKSSEHWKYYTNAFEFQGNPAMTGAGYGELDEPNPYLSDDEAPSDRTSTHRLAELFVEPMINSGEERERFKEIVQNVGDTLNYMDKVELKRSTGNYIDHMSPNWLADKREGPFWDQYDNDSDEGEEEEEDELEGEPDWLGPGGNNNYDFEEEMPSRSTTRKYKDKYSHDSDSSDGEDPELADDDEMVALKTGTTTRKRIPTKKRS